MIYRLVAFVLSAAVLSACVAAPIVPAVTPPLAKHYAPACNRGSAAETTWALASGGVSCSSKSCSAPFTKATPRLEEFRVGDDWQQIVECWCCIDPNPPAAPVSAAVETPKKTEAAPSPAAVVPPAPAPASIVPAKGKK